MGKPLPLPEIIADTESADAWEVRDSEDLRIAYVDFDKKEFVVPMDSTPQGEIVRAHEAAHVKISPRDAKLIPGDVENRTLQAAEDARVYSTLNLCGIEAEKVALYGEKDFAAMASSPKFTPLEAARTLLASRGTGHYRTVRGVVAARHPSIPEIVEGIAESLYEPFEAKGEIPPWDSAVEAARGVEAAIEAMEEDKQPSPGEGEGEGEGEPAPKGKGKPGDKPIPVTAPFDPTGEQGEIEIPEITSEERKVLEEIGISPENITAAEREKENKRFYGDDITRPSGEMRIQYPELDTEIKFQGITQKETASDSGVIPVGLHRYATDYRIFKRKGRRIKGAAILIDVSGSMHLTDIDIKNIIRQCPASVVALYSGEGGKKGTLRVVAEGKRYSKRLHAGMGGANIVDLPALKWLAARKEKKKLWICDGVVTGEGDRLLIAKELRECARVIQSARIERVGNVKQLLKTGKLIDKAFADSGAYSGL